MSLVKVLILLLPMLQAVSAYDVVSPFSWKAVEDAEKHATAAVTSLYADSLRLQQRVKEHVFAPGVVAAPPEPECNPIPQPQPIAHDRTAGSVNSLLLTLLAIPAAFLFGWVCGTRQALSRQAMQQAKAADEQAAAVAVASQHRELVTAESVVATPEYVAQCGSRTQPPEALTPIPYSISTQPQNGDQTAAESAAARPLSSVGSESDIASLNTSRPTQQASADDAPDSASSWGSVSEPDEQCSSQQQLHHQLHYQDSSAQPPAPCGEQQPSSSGQQYDEQTQQTLTAHQHPTSNQAAALHQHSAMVYPSMPSTSIRPDSGTPHTGMRPDNSRQEDGLALVNNASYLVDVITQRLGLNPQQLSEHERLGLVTPVVQAVGVLLDNRNNQEHHRLTGIANEQGAEHNMLLREGQTDTKAWRQAKEEQKQLQQFFNRLADCLMCGLILMLMGMLYWGVSLGYFEGRLSQCKSRRSGFLVNLWSPWQAVESLQTVWCYAAATIDLTGSVLLMLAVPYFVKRHGLLTNSMAQPMTGLILGLGVACGLVGQFTVSRVGGDNIAWLSMYWVWITLHVLSIWFVHGLYRFLSSEAVGGLSEQVLAGIKMPMYYSVMGIVLPLAVAACPYWRLILLS